MKDQRIERSVYWNKYNNKSENKDTTNEYRYFLGSKRYKSRGYYLPKGAVKNYNTKTFYDQPADFDIKQYEEIRKLTTGQGEDFTAGFLLDYDCIKNHYRLIAVDFSRQKVDADPKAIHQIEFVGQLKKLDKIGNVIDAGNNQSMFVSIFLEKIKETRLKFLQEV